MTEPGDEPVNGRTGRVWRLLDRLSEEDVAEIIRLFQAGTAQRVLANQFGISLTSVKVLLMQRGIKREKLG